MNLYRSFGNLMEAWMSEGSRCTHLELLMNDDEDPPTPSSQMETNQRSESVDSGVETASSDVSFHATASSSAAENTEGDTLTAEAEGHGFTQASQSSVPSCPTSSLQSSPSLRPSRAEEDSTTLHQKLEQALLRTHSQHVKENKEPLTADAVLRRLPGASSTSKRHAPEAAKRQRSESFDLRGEVRPRVPSRPVRRRPMSMIVDKMPSQRKLEHLSEEEGRGLSPGLSYLEQVCQTLEELARQQMRSQALQREMDALQERGDMEHLDGSRCDSPPSAVDVSSDQRTDSDGAQAVSSEPQRRKDYQRHFRQRSVSDANIATLHLRELNAGSRGQQLSTDDLLQELKKDVQKQESQKEKKASTISRNLRLKIGSLRREEASQREFKGQQMQPSEKTSTRRRLSQLFRRNQRKTQPE